MLGLRLGYFYRIPEFELSELCKALCLCTVQALYVLYCNSIYIQRYGITEPTVPLAHS